MNTSKLEVTDPRVEALLQRLPLPIAAVDRSGRVVFMNERATQWSGYSLADTPTLSDWRSKAFPDAGYRERITRHWDASVASADSAGTAIEPRDFEVVIASGDTRAVTVFGVPLQGGFLAAFVDNTEHVRHEQRLRDAQKLEAVGAVASGVAHEFNNLLAVLMGHVSLARRHAHSATDVASHLEHIESTALLARNLVRSMLTFAGHPSGPTKAISLRNSVQRAEELLRPLVPHGVSLEVSFPAEVSRVMADESLVVQMLLNLGLNAIDAMAGRTGTIVFQAVESPAFAGRPPRVVLRVQDEGVGMSDSVMKRAREPFFTTKANGLGFGLGLAIVESIARGFGAEVTLQSDQGRGSSVEILFPVQDATPRA